MSDLKQSSILERLFSRQFARQLAFAGASSLVVCLLLFIMAMINLDAPKIMGVPPLIVFLIAGVSFLFFAGLVFSAAYLEIFGEDELRLQRKNSDQLDSMARRFDQFEEQLERFSSAEKMRPLVSKVAEDVFSKKIKSTINDRISGDIKELVTAELVAAYAPSVVRERAVSFIKEFYDRFIDGIYRQIERQQRSANSNVWYGMVFGVLGLIAMGYITYEAYMKTGVSVTRTWESFVFEYIPKLTFVVLIESLAYFFLQAYKDDRAMLRYLRNEATNVESRTLGLLGAIHFGESKDVSETIKGLISTERNFTIKKGERIILDALQGEQKMLFDKLLERIIPDLSRRQETNVNKRA